MHSASNPHAFMGVTDTGLASIVKTRGNRDVHVILRGGSRGPNYAEEEVGKVVGELGKKWVDKGQGFGGVMVDCSREFWVFGLVFRFDSDSKFLIDGNSQKNHLNQPNVLRAVCAQLEAGQRAITGVMIESNINGGRQDVPAVDGTFLFPSYRC